jgi:arginine decarboxylase
MLRSAKSRIRFRELNANASRGPLCFEFTRVVSVIVDAKHLRHSNAPLLASALAFIERKQAPFYSPGHKGGRTLDPVLRKNLAALDLNNLPDTDTLHCPTGAIMEAEKLLADAYGVDRTSMLVGGSTSGNIGMLLATVGPGDEILLQRNAHKSVIAGIVHSGAVPVWLTPAYDADFGIALGVSEKAVEEGFAAHPKAKAVHVLNPTYFGTTPDIAALARVCARHGKLLLVDEAHGPHFHFCDELPRAAEDVGADAVVQSTHKILSALSQAAVLHTRDAAIDILRVRKVLQLIQTTSPNFAIMASIDTARRQMVLEGETLLRRTLELARHARAELARIPGLDVLGRAHTQGAASGFFNLDETKIVLRVDGLRKTGYEVQRELNANHGVQPELGGSNHVLFIMTIGNTAEDVARLVAGMRDVASSRGASVRPPGGASLGHVGATSALPPVAITPREAFYAASEACEFLRSEGRICAEVVTPYPPGIPVLMPGECVTREVLQGLAAVHEAHCPISMSDPTVATIRVVS